MPRGERRRIDPVAEPRHRVRRRSAATEHRIEHAVAEHRVEVDRVLPVGEHAAPQRLVERRTVALKIPQLHRRRRRRGMRFEIPRDAVHGEPPPLLLAAQVIGFRADHVARIEDDPQLRCRAPTPERGCARGRTDRTAPRHPAPGAPRAHPANGADDPRNRSSCPAGSPRRTPAPGARPGDRRERTGSGPPACGSGGSPRVLAAQGLERMLDGLGRHQHLGQSVLVHGGELPPAVLVRHRLGDHAEHDALRVRVREHVLQGAEHLLPRCARDREVVALRAPVASQRRVQRLEADRRDRAAEDDRLRLLALHHRRLHFAFEEAQPRFHFVEPGNARGTEILERVHDAIERGGREHEQRAPREQPAAVAREDGLSHLRTGSR